MKGLSLSGGPCRGLCIARTIAASLEVILLDEPRSALIPIASAKIEETLCERKQDVTIASMTHNLYQPARISDVVGFMYRDDLVEFDATHKVITTRRDQRADYFVTRALRMTDCFPETPFESAAARGTNGTHAIAIANALRPGTTPSVTLRNIAGGA
jgi:ABC-type transporter Mla maintaining outer membrane lipid asymmetry ATPase subunit MlaF